MRWGGGGGGDSSCEKFRDEKRVLIKRIFNWSLPTLILSTICMASLNREMTMDHLMEVR